MGCDGGTIPRRDELVRVKQKPEQKDKDADREFRWLYCALTQERLQEPIVMCGLGRLYSKQNVIEQLLEKEKMPESAKHIKTMKDIRTLNLTPNPAFTDEDKTEGLLDTRHAPYICKLIGLEMSGKFRFVGLWSCGCVMSERALKQIKSTAKVCPLCQVSFSVEDVIVLNGGEEDIELMKVKIEMRTAKRKKEKKEKKTNTKTGVSQPEQNDGASTSKAAANYIEVKKEDNENSDASHSNNAVIHHQTSSNPKNAKCPVNAPKRPGIALDTLQDPDLKRLKGEYSVASDPKASETYKSLFTSHKSEKAQTRAHWVTYNPFYN